MNHPKQSLSTRGVKTLSNLNNWSRASFAKRVKSSVSRVPPGPPGLIGFKGTRGMREPQGTRGRRGEQGVIGPPVKAGNQEWLDLPDQNEIKEIQGNQGKRVCRDRVVDLGKRYRLLEWLGFRQIGREGGITAFYLI